jgi:hypothetical protein
LEYEVIWGHVDILVVVVVRRLFRRWKVKTLLAGPSPTSPTSPMKAEITISPISNIYRAFKDGRDLLTPLIVAYDIRKLVELGSTPSNIDFRKPHYDGKMKSTFMGYTKD